LLFFGRRDYSGASFIGLRKIPCISLDAGIVYKLFMGNRILALNLHIFHGIIHTLLIACRIH
jgi:hypothetical protein